jgi:hypothetical protein
MSGRCWYAGSDRYACTVPARIARTRSLVLISRYPEVLPCDVAGSPA